MTTLLSLSDDVIEIILSYSDISFADIINFRCVCKKFRWAATTEEYCFLKKKFFQRWSSAKEYFDQQSKENEQKQSKEDKQKNEKSRIFIEMGISYAKQLWSDANYIHEENPIYSTSKVLIDNLLEKRFNQLNFREDNYINILFFMDESKHLLDQLVRAYDLTESYYYMNLLDNLRVCWRKVILERYIENTHEELLEKSATYWAQRLQLGKSESYSSVKASLNSIALEALNFLREKHPEHSIFSKPDEYFYHWENNNIDDNCWGEAEGIQIMDTLEEYMFAKLKFQSTYSTELKYSCIDYVLKNKHGNNIILYVIYESVARRLGLRCDIMQLYLYGTFGLFWMPRYTFSTNYTGDINLLRKIHRKNIRCIYFHPFYQEQSPIGIRKKYLRSLGMYKQTLAEIRTLIIYVRSRQHLTRIPNLTLIKYLENVVPETRPKNVKFAVGMIVTHGEEYTDCSTGVIIGWLFYYYGFIDYIKITSNMHMIPALKMCSCFNVGQILYIILTKNNKLCCVKGDDITLTKPSWIENTNIYHYFNKFKGTHYVPNGELAKIYPYDTALAAERIFKG